MESTRGPSQTELLSPYPEAKSDAAPSEKAPAQPPAQTEGETDAQTDTQTAPPTAPPTDSKSAE